MWTVHMVHMSTFGPHRLVAFCWPRKSGSKIITVDLNPPLARGVLKRLSQMRALLRLQSPVDIANRLGWLYRIVDVLSDQPGDAHDLGGGIAHLLPSRLGHLFPVGIVEIPGVPLVSLAD